MRPLLVLAGIALVLAGCSDAPPSGEFSSTRHNIVADGTLTAEYQQRDIGNYPSEDLCPPDVPSVPEELRCQEAQSTVSAHFMTLPEPSPAGYTLVWVDANGTVQEIGALVQNGSMWEFPEQTFNEYYGPEAYPEVQLRMGDTVVGRADNGADADFAAAEGLTTVTVTGTYNGPEFTITVSGAPEDAGYTGYFYEELENGTIQQVSGESHPVPGDGEHTFSASRNVADFAEFHLHIAGSSLNVAQATIE